MADVKIIPKISCDNCGLTVEKDVVANSRDYRKPKPWGSCRMEGSRDVDSYGGKSRLDFTDLCPECADAALNAAASALKARRGEIDL